MATSTTQENAEMLNSLVRGEISAVETYEQAINKFDATADAKHVEMLTKMKKEHEEAVAALKSHVVNQAHLPSESAGIWGIFASTVTGAAKIIGPVTVLAALKQGELHGIEQYEAACKDKSLPSECSFLIKNNLLEKCKKHVQNLEACIASIEGQKA